MIECKTGCGRTIERLPKFTPLGHPWNPEWGWLCSECANNPIPGRRNKTGFAVLDRDEDKPNTLRENLGQSDCDEMERLMAIREAGLTLKGKFSINLNEVPVSTEIIAQNGTENHLGGRDE